MARILIIDDDALLRNVLAKALVHAGHTVIQAEDGRQGIDLMRATEVDVAITDLIMPVQEGVETIIALRRDHPDVPVIAMSGGASNSPLYLEIAEKIGARHILSKPFLTRELVALIGEILASRKSRN